MSFLLFWCFILHMPKILQFHYFRFYALNLTCPNGEFLKVEAMKRTASDHSVVYVIYRPFRKSNVCIINICVE